MLKKISINSNQLINRNLNKLQLINQLIDYNHLVPEIVPSEWKPRHFKLIHLIGKSRYMELVHRAEKYGQQPAKLLAWLVDQELKDDT